jgi:hypothetical protein
VGLYLEVGKRERASGPRGAGKPAPFVFATEEKPVEAEKPKQTKTFSERMLEEKRKKKAEREALKAGETAAKNLKLAQSVNERGKGRPVKKRQGKKAPKRAAPKTAEGRPPASTAEPLKLSGAPVNRLRLVRQAIRRLAASIENVEDKLAASELIRLMTFEKELADELPNVKEIRVTWVEPAKTGS